MGSDRGHSLWPHKSATSSGAVTPTHSNSNSTVNLQAIRSHTSSPAPINSLNEDGGLISNILPSYHMYQLTVLKPMTMSTENFQGAPPTYELSPMSSPAVTPAGLRNDTHSDGYPFLTAALARANVDDENTFDEQHAALWENTILANAHKLPDLTKTNNSINNDLEIKVHVTEKVCRVGVPSKVVDTSNLEFKQGDFIHGYVTMANKSNKPVTFDMVYVVFEGVYETVDSRNYVPDRPRLQRVVKFVSMLDLFALWSFANISRLVTEDVDPTDWCDGETDPVDNTLLSIDVHRTFQPGKTYKRFFSFRVPEKLLDSACEEHSLTRHTEIPPSLGTSRAIAAPSQMLASLGSQVRDLSFIDAAITYSVDARVIGRALDYNFAADTGDQYVIAAAASCPIRVIPMPNPEFYYDRALILRESKLFYAAFVSSIQRKLEDLRAMLNGGANLLPLQSNSQSQQGKMRQLYLVASSTITKNIKAARGKMMDEDHSFQCLVPVKKKLLTGGSKVLGVLSLLTPREEYRSFYIPPPMFRTENWNEDTTRISGLLVPLELSYYVESVGSKLPEIKSLSTELVVLTIKSRKYKIPVEINHDMCFRDKEVDTKLKELDNFDTIVIKQFQKFFGETTDLIQKLGNDVIKFETQMYQDIKCLANLQTKYINLSVLELDTKFVTRLSLGVGTHSSVKSIPWEAEPDDKSGRLFSKKFDLVFNLNECHLKGVENKNKKGFDYITLVPSFQTCYMARLYFIKITVKLQNGEALLVNVPLTIERL